MLRFYHPCRNHSASCDTSGNVRLFASQADCNRLVDLFKVNCSPAQYAFDVNHTRRHLTSGCKALAASRLKQELAKEAKERQRLSEGRGNKTRHGKKPPVVENLPRLGKSRDVASRSSRPTAKAPGWPYGASDPEVAKDHRRQRPEAIGVAVKSPGGHSNGSAAATLGRAGFPLGGLGSVGLERQAEVGCELVEQCCRWIPAVSEPVKSGLLDAGFLSKVIQRLSGSGGGIHPLPKLICERHPVIHP